jgi:hypothetical protein
MTSFIYNDLEFSVEETQGRWTITYRNSDGKSGVVGAGLFAGLSIGEVEERAQRLVRMIFPVGIRCVGPDVTHPMTVGNLKIVPPDVTHANFIHWEKDSVSSL